MDIQDETLWAEGLDIVRKLEAKGHRAYLVGGCVRDRLLGRSLHDIDIATSAKPDEVIAQFAKTLPTGLKHGTVTVMEGGRSYEVTTFRQEFGFSDSRRPDEVAFVQDVREDLARRDFTFNAMAIGVEGDIVDPFGGQDALRAGVVECVGDASERFGEDALRMLRAIRFAAELDFAILPEVWQGIIRNRNNLDQVAMERVSAEWDKMMAGSGPEQACHYLFKSGLLVHAKEPFPESFRQAAERYRFNAMPSEWDKWGMDFTDDGSMGNLMQLPSIADPDLRWAALLAGMGVNEADSAELCRTLRFSSRRAIRIAGLVGMNEQLGLCEEDERLEGWILTVLARGRSLAEDWLTMSDALDSGFSPAAKDWLEAMPVYAINDLKVRGNELSGYLGRSPGPWIAEVLRQLLEAVAFGDVPNEKNALLSAAENASEEAGETDE